MPLVYVNDEWVRIVERVMLNSTWYAMQYRTAALSGDVSEGPMLGNGARATVHIETSPLL